jgi:hypothetical protein
VQAAFDVEASHANRKTQSFADFDENCDISLLITAFRSLPLFSLHLARRKVVLDAFDVETSHATRKKQSFADFDENSDISFLIETFRGLIAPYTLFYTRT